MITGPTSCHVSENRYQSCRPFKERNFPSCGYCDRSIHAQHRVYRLSPRWKPWKRCSWKGCSPTSLVSRSTPARRLPHPLKPYHPLLSLPSEILPTLGRVSISLWPRRDNGTRPVPEGISEDRRVRRSVSPASHRCSHPGHWPAAAERALPVSLDPRPQPAAGRKPRLLRAVTSNLTLFGLTSCRQRNCLETP